MARGVALQAERAHVGEIALAAAFGHRHDVVRVPEMPARRPTPSRRRGARRSPACACRLRSASVSGAADRADALVALEHLLAQVAGVGAQLPGVDARFGEQNVKRPWGTGRAAPAAHAAAAPCGPPTRPDWRGACSHPQFVAQAAHAVDDAGADLRPLRRKRACGPASPRSAGTRRSCCPSGSGGPVYCRRNSIESSIGPAKPASFSLQIAHQLAAARDHRQVEGARRDSAGWACTASLRAPSRCMSAQIQIEHRRAPLDQRRVQLEQAAHRLAAPEQLGRARRVLVGARRGRTRLHARHQALGQRASARTGPPAPSSRGCRSPRPGAGSRPAAPRAACESRGRSRTGGTCRSACCSPRCSAGCPAAGDMRIRPWSDEIGLATATCSAGSKPNARACSSLTKE